MALLTDKVAPVGVLLSGDIGTTVQAYVDVLAEAGTSYDVLSSDASKYIRLTNAGAKTATFRPESTLALPPSGEWHFRNVGAGDLTLVEGAGVTLNPQSGGTLVLSQNMTVTVKRVNEDEFDVFGLTVAV